MTLSRQHSETRVPELVSARCERLIAAPGTRPGTVGLLYLLADGVWYRMFVDAGLFFLDECAGPDSKDDLCEGESYVDLSSELACAGETIRELAMKNGVLTIRFSHTSVAFREDEEGAMRIEDRGGGP